MWVLVSAMALAAIGFLVFVSAPYLLLSDPELSRGIANPRVIPGRTVTAKGIVVDAESWDSELQYLRLVLRSESGDSTTLILNSNSTISISGQPPVSANEAQLALSELKGMSVEARVRHKLPWMAGDASDAYVLSAIVTQR